MTSTLPAVQREQTPITQTNVFFMYVLHVKVTNSIQLYGWGEMHWARKNRDTKGTGNSTKSTC